MYVVVSYGGEWDEKWENNEVCSRDEAKLNAWIAEQQKQRAEKEKFLRSLHDFYYAFSAEHPRRQVLTERKERKPWPPGLGQHQITPEMRAERQAIDDHNQAIYGEAVAIENDWRENTWFPALREWLTAQGKPVPATIEFGWSLGKNYFEEVNYRIETLEEI